MPYFIGFCFSLPISMGYLAPQTPLQENKPKPLLLNCYPCFLFRSYFCATIMSTNTQYEKNSSPVRPSAVCFLTAHSTPLHVQAMSSAAQKEKRRRENLRVKRSHGQIGRPVKNLLNIWLQQLHMNNVLWEVNWCKRKIYQKFSKSFRALNRKKKKKPWPLKNARVARGRRPF